LIDPNTIITTEKYVQYSQKYTHQIILNAFLVMAVGTLISTKRKSKNAVAANNDGHSSNKQVEA
jgi:putative Ca2+/H+ antiporter (TMEM165/GDT1 family)